ncbi:MAG: hypothetical protein GX242_05480 [Clostridiales bacterium]|nr:hypothetical protein [Clostridiales bacterium]
MKVKQIISIIKGLDKAQVQEFLYNLFRRPSTFPKLKNKTKQNKVLHNKAVNFRVKGEFYDHIEMSGTYASAIISYGQDAKKRLRIFRHVTFPSLRLKHDMTTSSVCHNFTKEPKILVNGVMVNNETLERVYIKGNLELTSNFKNGLRIVRSEIISKNYEALIEKTTITNLTKNKVNLEIIADVKPYKISHRMCKNGDIKMVTALCGEQGDFELDKETKLEKDLVPKASFTFYAVYMAVKDGIKVSINLSEQIRIRNSFIDTAMDYTTLETPNHYINALYSHCMIRGVESIFETQKGLLHSPGGGRYYAAIWANDELEYASPIAPFLKSDELTTATKNAINLYVNYMDTSDVPFEHKNPLPSSIINGVRPYGVAGDRGDTVMVGLGLALFLLNLGNQSLAKEYLWAVEWCVEFCNSRKTKDGVIYSDSDELEGRFPSGNCNLSTNINYYMLLDSAIVLQKELGIFDKAECYEKMQKELKKAIKTYFEGQVEGFDTYRYYENNQELRSWICLPLIAGIFDRKEGTIKALITKLYKDGKMLTSSKRTTVWDRSLLFALKGIFMSGETDIAMKYLSDYSYDRLLGMHSPYPYEAYPEGNGAQLSGESLLYLRIIIEGMFGIKSIGLGKYEITPKVPFDGVYKLNKIMLGNKLADIEVEKGKITVKTVDKTFTGLVSLVVDFGSN